MTPSRHPVTPPPATGEVVVLVDRNDRETGTMSKADAHRKGVLHRAVSVLVRNAAGEMLLQRRALGKYHSPGLWSNACCTHPRPGESPLDAARRRLREELGIKAQPTFLFHFIYRLELDRGAIEHEYDHVFTATYDGPVRPDPAEVMDHRWVGAGDLAGEMAMEPESFTGWFRIIMGEAEGSAWRGD